MNTNLLRAAMAERGMTQKKLAQIMGISENSLSRKITGKRDFTLTEAIAICDALHLRNPAYIFFARSSQMRNERREDEQDERTENL